eukprot:c25859_g1_i1.p1 GENE.c25859_g1_i1~~c25859_g1_i1.p1  ORF type:complete len:910 (+),score=175.42 c25859_g1_i1:126-2732(+)
MTIHPPSSSASLLLIALVSFCANAEVNNTDTTTNNRTVLISHNHHHDHVFESCEGLSEGLLVSDCNAWQDLFLSTSGHQWVACGTARRDPCGQCGGGVVCRDQNIVVISLPGNRLRGSIPHSINSLYRLRKLDLSSNSLKSSIPSIANLTLLDTLDLHHNYLTGDVPILEPLVSLTQLRLDHNRLSGEFPTELPRSLLGTPQRAAVISVMHNRLSCELPHIHNAFQNIINNNNNNNNNNWVQRSHFNVTTLMAIGNSFSVGSDGLPSWLGPIDSNSPWLFVSYPPNWVFVLAVLAFGLTLLLISVIVTVGITNVRSFLRAVSRFQNDWNLMLCDDCVTGLKWVGCVQICLLMPIFFVSANFYSCGTRLLSLSIAFLEVKSSFAWIVALLMSLQYLLAITFLIYVLSTSRLRAWRDLAALAALSTGRTLSERIVGTLHDAWLLMLWVACMVAFHVPCFLFILAYNAPDDVSSFALPFETRRWRGALRWGTPVFLAVVTQNALPALASQLVRSRGRSVGMPGASLTSMAERRLVMRVWLFSCYMLSLVLPAVTVVILDEECGQFWKIAWRPCFQEGGANEPLPGVCSRMFDRDGFCPRRVVDHLSFLSILFTIWLATISPSLDLLFLGTSVGQRLCLKLRSGAEVFEYWTALITNRVTRVRAMSADPSVDELGTEIVGYNHQKLVLSTMVCVQLSIVLGPFAPLVTAMCLLCICTTRATYVYLVRKVNRAQTASTQPVHHLVISSLSMHVTLLLWFFWDSKFAGAPLVTAVCGLGWVVAYIFTLRHKVRNKKAARVIATPAENEPGLLQSLLSAAASPMPAHTYKNSPGTPKMTYSRHVFDRPSSYTSDIALTEGKSSAAFSDFQGDGMD